MKTQWAAALGLSQLLLLGACTFAEEDSFDDLAGEDQEQERRRRDAGVDQTSPPLDAGTDSAPSTDSGAPSTDSGAPPAPSVDSGAPPPPSPPSATGPLPTGRTGLAAGYTNDVGIKGHPNVIFADDFESYASVSDLNKGWDAVYQTSQLRIATDAANIYRGGKALEMRVPQQSSELSNALDKVLTQERDVVFLRYYTKFSSPFAVVGSSHNGAFISAHYFVNGQATPGVPANGTNKFLVSIENGREDTSVGAPGLLNAYIYHPEQRSEWGDHFFPTGEVMPFTYLPGNFGPTFVSRPNFTPALNRWYCYELMVKANTPGQRDGRIAMWIDGALVADFPNLRLRDVNTLKIDRLSLALHAKSTSNGALTKWYDNVVAATTYIGPL